MVENALVEPLFQKISDVWSGRIEVHSEDRVIGEVVLSQGRIAWATISGQSETLGVLLWRLGRLSREQLIQVQEDYQRYAGGKKLGAILEESGFMRRPVLRRCIMLHTRSALERLMSTPGIEIAFVDGEHDADEQILFGPEEVLPSVVSMSLVEEWMRVDNTWVRSWFQWNSENRVLKPLQDLPGYMASAVISADGDIVTAHVAHPSVDLTVQSVFVAAMLEASTRAVSDTALASIDQILLECAGGGLAAQWLDECRTNLVFVMTSTENSAPAVRYAIKKIRLALLHWLTKRDLV